MFNKVSEYRILAGLTQTALAKKANISRPYLSAIEKGKQTTISNIVMSKIATALDKSVIEVFFSSGVVCKQHEDRKDVTNGKAASVQAQ